MLFMFEAYAFWSFATFGCIEKASWKEEVRFPKGGTKTATHGNCDTHRY